MDERLALTQAGSDWRASRGGIAFSERGIGCWDPASGNSTGFLAVNNGHEAERRSAQPHRLVEHRVKHRGEIAGRRIDDAEHLGGRGLLFESLAGFGNEPRILYRYDRLRCKVLQQSDLLVGEWPNLAAIGGDHTKKGVVSAQRDEHRAAHPLKLYYRLTYRIVDLCPIRDLQKPGTVE